LKLGMTMVYVTHDRVDALSLGDELAILSAGRLMAYGPPDSLLRTPPNSYTARFLGGMLIIDGAASQNQGSALIVRTQFGTYEVPNSGHEGAVKLCIPPNSLRILKEASSRSILGTVSGVVKFPSSSFRIRVNTEVGPVEIQSDQVYNEVKIGERVYLGFDPQDCVLLDN
jgi:putative spermidine/putrescine transport system ATP-binding protein